MVSEPLGDLPGVWNEVPESSWGVVQPGQDELGTIPAGRRRGLTLPASVLAVVLSPAPAEDLGEAVGAVEDRCSSGGGEEDHPASSPPVPARARTRHTACHRR